MTDPSRVVPVKALRSMFTDLGEFVIVRNEDVFANFARGGDADLLVLDIERAEQVVVAHLGPPRVVQRRSYVVGLYYPWGYVDLFPRVEWRGAEFLSKADIFEHAVVSTIGYPKPRPAHEALVCWFSSLLWGGFFKERYRDLILAATCEDGQAFRAACIHAAGRRWGNRLWDVARIGHPEKAVAWVPYLRRAVWWQAFRRDPRGTLRRYASFWKHEIALRRSPPLPCLAVLGPDGSGKTSVISSLATRFAPPVCRGVQVVHWRPGIVNKPDERSGPVTDPHGKPPRGMSASIAKLGMLVADWWLGYCWLANLRARGTLVIFDRHYIDLLVDPQRYRYGGPTWLAKLVGRLIPTPDVVVLLDAPVETLRSRKTEVSQDELVRLRRAYREFVEESLGGYVLDAARPIHLVAADVERIIWDSCRRPAVGSEMRVASSECRRLEHV